MSKLWGDLKQNMKEWSSAAVEKAEEVSKVAVAKTEELTKISKIKLEIHQPVSYTHLTLPTIYSV